MVESGEWDRYGRFTHSAPGCLSLIELSLMFRILLQLRYQLRDSGWLDSTRAQMLGKCNTLTSSLLLASNQIHVDYRACTRYGAGFLS